MRRQRAAQASDELVGRVASGSAVKCWSWASRWNWTLPAAQDEVSRAASRATSKATSSGCDSGAGPPPDVLQLLGDAIWERWRFAVDCAMPKPLVND